MSVFAAHKHTHVTKTTTFDTWRICELGVSRVCEIKVIELSGELSLKMCPAGKWQLLWTVRLAVLKTCDDTSQVIPNHISL